MEAVYVFDTRFMNDLRIGAGILREMMEVHVEKQERAARQKEIEQDEALERVFKVSISIAEIFDYGLTRCRMVG